MTRDAGNRELWIERLGVMDYARALDFQRAVAKARIASEIPEDVLLLLEHPPVVTLGRSSKEAHLLASPQLLAARGVELFEVERGGDVTFHGPGQLVGYPIIDLTRHKKDLHWYLRQVEETLIVALATFGVVAERNPGLTGVWTPGDAETRRRRPSRQRKDLICRKFLKPSRGLEPPTPPSCESPGQERISR